MHKTKLRDKTKFFPPSPTLDPIPQTIKEYFEIYCQTNLDMLCLRWGKQKTQEVIIGLLGQENIGMILNGIADGQLKTICCVFSRLLNGKLTESEPLMQSLKGIEKEASLQDLNQIISTEISRYTKEFFKGIRISSPTVPLAQFLPKFL